MDAAVTRVALLQNDSRNERSWNNRRPSSTFSLVIGLSSGTGM
jgi:hypothetical protein